MSFDIGQRIRCNHIDYTGKYWGNPSEIDGCPKCKGVGEYYDVEWNASTGSIAQVENLDLLEELVMKAVMTEIGDNRFHPEYGTSIVNSIANVASAESVARTVEAEVGRALGQIYLRQQQQIQLGQDMSDDELIYRVDKIETRVVDPRTLTVTVSIVTESGNEVAVEI